VAGEGPHVTDVLQSLALVFLGLGAVLHSFNHRKQQELQREQWLSALRRMYEAGRRQGTRTTGTAN
jgi:hypothetical protein